MAEFPPNLPSFKGLVKALLLSHHTLFSSLLTMLADPSKHFLRASKDHGEIFNKGLQFRNGLDSEHGEVVFLMKDNNFWHSLAGADYSKSRKRPFPYLGHVVKKDFMEFEGEANKGLATKWFEQEAQMYDFRPPSSALGGEECGQQEWSMSWCNTQLHIGDNVNLDHVWKVYVPAWLIFDDETVGNIKEGGVDLEILRKYVLNKMPNFPTDGNNVPAAQKSASGTTNNSTITKNCGDNLLCNPLNGLFHLYGPKKAAEHYFSINRLHDKYRKDHTAQKIYSVIFPKHTNYTIQTRRETHGKHGTAPVHLHERAFVDLEIKYMADLVELNKTTMAPSEAANIRKLQLFSYDTRR